jgi:hypothetical protein
MKQNRSKRLGLVAVLTTMLTLMAAITDSGAGSRCSSPVPPLGITGDLQFFNGPLTISLPVDLRAPTPDKISFRLELPGSPLLPSKVYLLKEERALLRWHEPASARDPYPATGELWSLLSEIPARILIALCTGSGLEEYLTVDGSRQKGGRTISRGTLIERETVLETVSGRARILKMTMQGGVLALKWRYQTQARRVVLDVTLPGGDKFRIRMRAPRNREISEEEWVYLDQ